MLVAAAGTACAVAVNYATDLGGWYWWAAAGAATLLVALLGARADRRAAKKDTGAQVQDVSGSVFHGPVTFAQGTDLRINQHPRDSGRDGA